MRFSRSSLTERRVCCETSPHSVSGSLTSFHRSATVRSVSAGTLATGVSSFQCGIGLLDGGYAPRFGAPLRKSTTQRTLPSSATVFYRRARVRYACGRASRMVVPELPLGDGAHGVRPSSGGHVFVAQVSVPVDS